MFQSEKQMGPLLKQLFTKYSTYVDVQWFENGRLVGKKVYLEELIEQRTRQNSFRHFVIIYWSQILLGVLIFSIQAIFLWGHSQL